MPEVERKLSNKQLDAELQKVKFKSASDKANFEQVSRQTWFRQYAKGSKAALVKITKKVKRGIRHGKYTYMQLTTGDASRGTVKKMKRPQVNKQLEKTMKKISRKQRENIKQKEKRAPSGRKYSYTEIHEGIHSKRAKEWRKKNKISEKDV